MIIFLLFEPRGLFGIWVKIRNYWKGWPFTYLITKQQPTTNNMGDT